MSEVSYLELYQSGKEAFERGDYTRSIEYLTSAAQLISFNSFNGGEVRMWLVTAYQAADKTIEAIELVRNLTEHPSYQIRKQSRQLLYILEAPQLKLPPQWSVVIPEVNFSQDSTDRKYSNMGSFGPSKKKPVSSERITAPIKEDNSFIWFALLVCALISAALIIESFR